MLIIKHHVKQIEENECQEEKDEYDTLTLTVMEDLIEAAGGKTSNNKSSNNETKEAFTNYYPYKSLQYYSY